MDKPSEVELSIIKERGEKWAQWRELCAEAERLKEQGAVDMMVPIELLLIGRDAVKSVERFYAQLFTEASRYKSPSKF